MLGSILGSIPGFFGCLFWMGSLDRLFGWAFSMASLAGLGARLDPGLDVWVLWLGSLAGFFG